jgi:uncharacterized protein YcbX
MKGEQIDQGEFTDRGLIGDRAYALLDTDTGKVVSAKSVRLFPNILGCSAEFVESPQQDQKLPPVRISLPDGISVTSESSEVDGMLSKFFGRNVTLAQAAPDDFTIDQYHPDVVDADPAGHRDKVVEQKLGSAFFAEAEATSPVPVGSFFDLFPVSAVTTSTLDQLSSLQPESNFDERRFRMNMIINTKDKGFVENQWIDRILAIGDQMQLTPSMPDPRCVMTTLAQDDLPKDNDILRALVKHNRLQIGESGNFPCAGVYCIVQKSGSVRIGDAAVTI